MAILRVTLESNKQFTLSCRHLHREASRLLISIMAATRYCCCNEQSNKCDDSAGDGKGGFTQAKGSPFPAGHDPNDIAMVIQP